VTDDADKLGALIQLHVAEYNALTNRCTYRILIQFSVWGVILVYVPLVSSAWNRGHHDLLLWFSALVMQGALAIWQENLIEIYRSIAYVENVQRPLIQEFLPDQRFWCYEPHLARSRPKRAVWWEYLFPSLILAAILLIGGFRLFELSGVTATNFLLKYGADGAGLAVNLLVFAFSVRSTVSAVKLRNSMVHPLTCHDQKGAPTPQKSQRGLTPIK